MNKVQARTLSGFMELLPPEQIYFEGMLEILRETYRCFGFTPLDTPVIEASEVLLAKGGGETEKQIYRFQKGEHDLSLRYDLTVPLAKYVALHHGDLTFPFRRYQIGKVYRGERAQRGRFREFYQADIDIIGSESLAIANDAEMIQVISHIFQKLGLENFVLRINNRKILTGFYQMKNLQEKSTDIMRIVDKLDKIGREAVEKLLQEEAVPSPTEILDFLSLKGSNTEILSALEGYGGKNETFDQGVAELKEVCGFVGNDDSVEGREQGKVQIDLTIARGLDYYTGTVYETFLTEHPEIGSICSGGRYDNLAEYYTKKKLPGVGISIGLTRLFFVLEQQKALNPEGNTAPCTVLVLPMGENFSYSGKVAIALRQEGISTQVYYEPKKFKQKIAYVDKMNVPYAIILGEEEEEKNLLTLRNMETGEQNLLSISQVQDVLKAVETKAWKPFKM